MTKKSKTTKNNSDNSSVSEEQSSDISEVEVKKLISKGKEKGYLTYDELAKVLSPEKFSSEKIEDIQAMISDLGISCKNSLSFSTKGLSTGFKSIVNTVSISASCTTLYKFTSLPSNILNCSCVKTALFSFTVFLRL